MLFADWHCELLTDLWRTDNDWPRFKVCFVSLFVSNLTCFGIRKVCFECKVIVTTNEKSLIYVASELFADSVG